MTFSANEIMGLMSKAARGAGAPPGQAAQFGRAALCHLVQGRDVADLLGALEAVPSGPVLDLPLALLRLQESRMAETARGAIPDSPLAQSYAAALPFKQTLRTQNNQLFLTLHLDAPAAPLPAARITLAEDVVSRLSAWAARILVPETDASRRAGAGAGLTDND